MKKKVFSKSFLVNTILAVFVIACIAFLALGNKSVGSTSNYADTLITDTLPMVDTLVCDTIVAPADTLSATADSLNGEPAFMRLSAKEGLKDALLYYDIRNPEIVYAQALIETANFTAKNCMHKNNLFGLMQGRKLRTFEHWSESVLYYKKKIQGRYTGGDYYTFLRKIRYATSPTYTKNLKKRVAEVKRKHPDLSDK
ncbi:MAG: glucosaminidase domain-containing protein [Bacteroidaceae bacterium]|nr:glucosaminidase domain-containing protein [Bacteroidaceae bacterium]